MNTIDLPAGVEYIPDFVIAAPSVAQFASYPWERRTTARSECFMADAPLSYAYGRTGTYTAGPVAPFVRAVMTQVRRPASGARMARGRWASGCR